MPSGFADSPIKERLFRTPLDNRSEKIIIILLLLLLHALVFFPFRCTTGLLDRDSYRMLLGMLDSAKHSTYFASPLLYNRQVSFGYYGLIYTLSAPFGYAPGTLIQTMNLVSLVAGILFVIPFFAVVDRLFDRAVAVTASVILALVPVWWNGALYGHPTMPGMLPFFAGLALILGHRTPKMSVIIRVLAVVLFAFSLSFRFDLILLSPALAGAICYQYRDTAHRVRETAFYVLGAVALFILVQRLLPAVKGGPAPDSIVVLLQRFQDPTRVFELTRQAIIQPLVAMGGAFGPLLLIISLPSFWIVIGRKNLSQILFTLGVIVPGAVFWLPNPLPVRHYVPLAPAVSTAVAVSALWFVSKVPNIQLRTVLARTCGPIVGLACVAASIGLHYAPGKLGKFESPFWLRFTLAEYEQHASQLANDLVSLTGPKNPVLIVCDANFVAARMEMLASGVTVRLHEYPFHNRRLTFDEVDYEGRTFMMYEAPFYPDLVEAALDQLNLYPTYPVLFDPYLTNAYHGSRLQAHLARGPAGEQIQLDRR